MFAMQAFAVLSILTVLLCDVFFRTLLGRARLQTGRIDISPQRFFSYAGLIFYASVFAVVLAISRNILVSLAFSTSSYLLGLIFLWRNFRNFNAIKFTDKFVDKVFLLLSLTSLAVVGMVLYVILRESWHFFKVYSVVDFLFSTSWDPDSYATDRRNAFGILPVMLGTFYTVIVALLISFPLGFFSAIYVSEYTNPRARSLVKTIFEIIAGIPTVVYGYFAAFILLPFLASTSGVLGLEISLENPVIPGIVIGIMITPYITTLLDDTFSSVPQSVRDAAITLGATKSETICRVLLPLCVPGIVAAGALTVSRAVGETMIVVITCGVMAFLSLNPFAPTTTATVQIVHLLVGDVSFDDPKALAAFAIALVLFTVTMMLNTCAFFVRKKYSKSID